MAVVWFRFASLAVPTHEVDMTTPVKVFDLDFTLLKGDSSHLWCYFLVEKGLIADPKTFLAREDELMQRYNRGVSRVEDFIHFSSSAVAVIPFSQLQKLLDEYVETKLRPLKTIEGQALITECQEKGIPCVVISATASYIVKRAAALFGVPSADVLAVDVAVKDDYLTTEIVGVPSFRDGKITRLKMWLEQKGITEPEISFYTDSINDLPLCLMAKYPHAINASPALAAEAKSHGWVQAEWHCVGEDAQ